VKPLPSNDLSFTDAIALAVKAGRAAAQGLQLTFDKVDRQLTKAIQLVEPFKQDERNDDGAGRGMAEVFVDQLKQRSSEMRGLFKRQRAALDSVNLALFGRTGAGKSSLIEAMTHGDGATVSPGESDWTTSVRHVDWKGCRLHDTPGTNGWGGREDRLILENHARGAVEIADVVLLCFDSQSQQQPEFQKVAEWIRAFGKPAIAVLNCRNPRWRLPPRTSLSSARRTVAEQVRQHEGNIRDELIKMGLENVPVVAISCKRALMARGQEPFRGPDAVTFKKQRQEYGPDRLLHWSNLVILEQLLANALLVDARGIRLGMLVANVKGLIEELTSELAVMNGDARKVAKTLDSTIAGLLRILGYPGDQDARTPFQDRHLGVDLLVELERLRGGRFEMAEEGEFQAFCAQLLSARFASLRSRSLATAEELVLTAFNKNEELKSERFNQEVYHAKEIDGAAKEVLNEAGNFLQRKVKLAIRDGQTDLDCLIQAASEVEGNAGTGWKWTGRAARAGGLLSGAASATILALAAANIWNPGGWVLAAAGIGGAILSFLFGWGGRAAERKAEAKRAKARREALASASQHVHDTFDAFVNRIAEAAAVTGRKTMAAVLAPPLREAVAARSIMRAAKVATQSLASLAQALPRKEPQRIIADAARRMEQANGAGHSGRWLWLGEDWIDDPSGLDASKGSNEPVTCRRGPRVTERIANAIHDAFSMHTGRPRCGDGRKWLESAGRLLSDVPGAGDALASARRLLDDDRPRIVLVGDYNTGKSSFIKRLLVEAGLPIPKKLEIRANPTTKDAQEYEWSELIFIDSPGLQSGRADDEEVAFESLQNASHLICLFQPNILGSTIERLAPVLRGDPSVGRAPKLGRSLLVLNRSDELGVDPSDDPDEFDRLAQRKQVELIKAFARRGVEVPEGRVVCMASDPFGHVGERQDVNAAQYDEYRSWDGFNTFINSIKDLRSEALRIGADIAALEGGMARIGSLRTTRRRELVVARAQLAFTKRLYQLLDAAASEASRIRGHIEARLDALLDQTTQAHIQDAMGAATDDEIEEAGMALSQWWKDKAFKTNLERWGSQSQTEIDRWFNRTNKEVGRRMQSREFLQAHPEVRSAFDSAGMGGKNSTKGAWWKIVQSVGEAGAQPRVVYDIAKFFGTKFRPWGAVNLATKIGRFAPYLAGLGVALDGWDWFQTAKSSKERENARKKATHFLHSSGDEIRKSLLGGNDQSKGPRAYLEDRGAEIIRLRDKIGIEIAMREAAVKTAVAHIQAFTDALADARKKLGLPPEEVTYV
jgi:predicted GTPase